MSAPSTTSFWTRAALFTSVMLGGGIVWFGRAPTWFAMGLAAVLLMSLALMHAAVGALDFRRITFPAFWFVTYLAAVFVPGLVVAADRSQANEAAFLFAITSVLITAPLGMLVVNLASGFRRPEIASFFDRPVESGEPGLHWKMVYWGVVVVATLLVVQYLREVPTIPLWYLLKHPGSAAELVFLREDSFKLLDSPLVYFYDVLRRVGFPVLTAMAFGNYRLGRKRTWLLTFLAVTILGVFFSSLSLAKMPVALIALVGCFYWYLQRGGRLSLRAIVGGITLVLLFPIAVLMQLRASTEVSIDVILTAIAKRLFVLPAEILYAYFEIFPRTVGFLHGRTIGRVAWAMGEPLFDLSNYAFNYVFPTGVSSGSAPAAFIGFFYADFGLPGVVFGGFLAGVIMQLVHVYLIRRPKTVIGLAAYAFMYWAFWQINLAALPQTMLSGGVAFVLAGLWLFDLGERGLRRATVPLAPSSAPRAG